MGRARCIDREREREIEETGFCFHGMTSSKPEGDVSYKDTNKQTVPICCKCDVILVPICSFYVLIGRFRCPVAMPSCAPHLPESAGLSPREVQGQSLKLEGQL